MIRRPKISFLPKGKEGSGLLPWVIAVMMYLCALALGAGFGLDHAVEGWTLDLTDKVTVQVVQENVQERERQVAAAVEALEATPGVVAADPLEAKAINSLLEPWLGAGNVTADLPIPALIDVTLDQSLTINLPALAAQLRTVAPDARLDDHQQWIGDLLLVAGSIEITAGLIVALIIFSTVAIVIFGTSGGLAAHQERIEVMHMIGAEDSMIAEEFQHRYMIHGFLGGLLGLMLAGATGFVLFQTVSRLGGGLMVEFTVSGWQWSLLAMLPIISAIVTMLTARLTVYRALRDLV